MFDATKLKNIILAEDDGEDADIFREILAELNPAISLTVVENGILLMALLERTEQLPDLIFIDINMPVKNGLQCLKEIKNDDKLNKISTIILSTSSHQKQIDESYSNGAFLYITKPTSYTEFKSLLLKCVQPVGKDEIKTGMNYD